MLLNPSGKSLCLRLPVRVTMRSETENVKGVRENIRKKDERVQWHD